MKKINETFTDEEFERLKKAKGKKTWHDFILNLAEEKLWLLLAHHPRNEKKARQLKKCTNLTVAEQYLIDAEDWREKAEKGAVEVGKE